MAKALRESGKRPPAFWETVQARIKTDKAVDICNRVLNGAEVSAQQERMAVFLINKFCPNLQAIAIQMEHKRPETRQDINSLLASTGIRPEQAWAAINGSPALEGEVVENSDDNQNVSKAPAPPK